MSILVIINSAESGPRRLTGWLEEVGVDVDARLGADGLPATLDGYDGLVLLGGGLMPDADEEAPWLPTERQLVEQALADGVPTLGICLGGQLIAHVAGGEVRGNYGTPESGMVRITTTAAGQDDPVLGALGEGAPMIENHVDQITRLPAGAVLLAESADVQNQAFRVGDSMWGLQFHPEVPAQRIAQWNESALARKGFDRQALVAAALAADTDNTRAARALVHAFAAQVRTRKESA